MPPIVVNCTIGISFLLAFVPTVLALYGRGYGRFSAVVGLVVLPAAGLRLSAGAPAWLCWTGKRRHARRLAIACIFFLWAPYFVLVAAAAAI